MNKRDNLREEREQELHRLNKQIARMDELLNQTSGEEKAELKRQLKFLQVNRRNTERALEQIDASEIRADPICGDEWLSLVKRQHGQRDVNVIVSKDETLIVPLTDDGDIIMTTEPSPALDMDVMVLPGGEIEEGELSLDAGNRELQEEIGYRAESLDYLMTLHPWSKYLTTASHIYLARDLVTSQLEGDEDYEIDVVRVPLDDFEQLIATGQLTDARIVAALYMTKRFLQWEAVEQVAAHF
jgi:ADP-ribose diphosphatase